MSTHCCYLVSPAPGRARRHCRHAASCLSGFCRQHCEKTCGPLAHRDVSRVSLADQKLTTLKEELYGLRCACCGRSYRMPARDATQPCAAARKVIGAYYCDAAGNRIEGPSPGSRVPV